LRRKKNKLEEILTELKETLSEEEENHIFLLKNFSQFGVSSTKESLQIIEEKIKGLPSLSPIASTFSDINDTLESMGENLDIGGRIIEDSKTVFAGYAGEEEKEKISDE